MKRHFTLRSLFAAVALVAIVCLALFVWRERKRMILRSVLPSPASITRLTASLDYLPSGGQIEEFDVPEAFYERIIDELYHASPDDKPAKWMTLGRLAITRDEEPFVKVGLYIIPQEDPAELAYSIDGNPRRYFRGGNADALAELIQQAHDESNQK